MNFTFNELNASSLNSNWIVYKSLPLNFFHLLNSFAPFNFVVNFRYSYFSSNFPSPLAFSFSSPRVITLLFTMFDCKVSLTFTQFYLGTYFLLLSIFDDLFTFKISLFLKSKLSPIWKKKKKTICRYLVMFKKCIMMYL